MKYTGERFILGNNFCGPDTNIHKEHISRYQFASNYTKGKKILDIACGVGYGCKIFIENGAKYVIGCDISDEAIDYAKEHFSAKNIEFHKKDIRNLDFPDETFDCVVSFETLEHVTEQDLVISELKRVLKKGGILIISTPNKEVRSFDEEDTNIFHEKELTIDEFKNLLSHFLKFELYSQRLIKDINLGKKIMRNIILKCIKYDSMKIYTKIFPQKFYGMMYTTIDNTDGNYIPVPYDSKQQPLILIGICYK